MYPFIDILLSLSSLVIFCCDCLKKKNQNSKKKSLKIYNQKCFLKIWSENTSPFKVYQHKLRNYLSHFWLVDNTVIKKNKENSSEHASTQSKRILAKQYLYIPNSYYVQITRGIKVQKCDGQTCKSQHRYIHLY